MLAAREPPSVWCTKPVASGGVSHQAVTPAYQTGWMPSPSMGAWPPRYTPTPPVPPRRDQHIPWHDDLKCIVMYMACFVTRPKKSSQASSKALLSCCTVFCYPTQEVFTGQQQSLVVLLYSLPVMVHQFSLCTSFRLPEGVEGRVTSVEILETDNIPPEISFAGPGRVQVFISTCVAQA